MGVSESSESETRSVTTATTRTSRNTTTTGQQTFVIPDRHMLPEHAVKRSLLVFDDAVQDNPRQNREEIRLLGIVRSAHAQINQLKTQHTAGLNSTEAPRFPGKVSLNQLPSDLDQVVRQSSHAREVWHAAEKLRVLGEAHVNAVQQLSDGADPLLLTGRSAVWRRAELLQGFVQRELAALQTLLMVLHLQQRVLGPKREHLDGATKESGVGLMEAAVVLLTCRSIS